MLHATALKKMKYYIQSSLRISSQSYYNTYSIPLHAAGQGLGSYGSNLIFISVPLFKELCEEWQGCEMMSSDKKITITKRILGLVDDTRQYSNNWYNDDLNKTIHNLENS